MSAPPELLIAGTASTELATAVSREVHLPLAQCHIERFPDGEVSVEIGESVRRREVVLVQSTSPPVNDHLVELLLLADACRRAAASHITAIVPYFGYARSDRRAGRRAPVAGSAAASMLESSGIGHIITIDVHAPQIEGFFRIPTDDLSAVTLLDAAIQPMLEPDVVIVAPDLGAVRRASETSRRLGRQMALCVKRRYTGTDVEVTGVVGDVSDQRCVIVDDMISTGGTVVEAARALRKVGAREIIAVAATHGVFVPGAADRLVDAGVGRVVVTDTVAPPGAGWGPAPALEVVSVAPLVAAIVRRLQTGESLRDLPGATHSTRVNR